MTTVCIICGRRDARDHLNYAATTAKIDGKWRIVWACYEHVEQAQARYGTTKTGAGR